MKADAKNANPKPIRGTGLQDVQKLECCLIRLVEKLSVAGAGSPKRTESLDIAMNATESVKMNIAYVRGKQSVIAQENADVARNLRHTAIVIAESVQVTGEENISVKIQKKEPFKSVLKTNADTLPPIIYGLLHDRLSGMQYAEGY